MKIAQDLDRELVRRIDHIAIDLDLYRYQTIERLLRIAVEEVEQKGVQPPT